MSVRANINEVENRKTSEKSINPKGGSLKKISKTDISGCTDQEKVKTQFTKIRSKRGDITTKLIKMKRIMREYYEQFYDKNWITEMKWTNC